MFSHKRSRGLCHLLKILTIGELSNSSRGCIFYRIMENGGFIGNRKKCLKWTNLAKVLLWVSRRRAIRRRTKLVHSKKNLILKIFYYNTILYTIHNVMFSSERHIGRSLLFAIHTFLHSLIYLLGRFLSTLITYSIKSSVSFLFDLTIRPDCLIKSTV